LTDRKPDRPRNTGVMWSNSPCVGIETSSGNLDWLQFPQYTVVYICQKTFAIIQTAVNESMYERLNCVWRQRTSHVIYWLHSVMCHLLNECFPPLCYTCWLVESTLWYLCYKVYSSESGLCLYAMNCDDMTAVKLPVTNIRFCPSAMNDDRVEHSHMLAASCTYVIGSRVTEVIIIVAPPMNK